MKTNEQMNIQLCEQTDVKSWKPLMEEGTVAPIFNSINYSVLLPLGVKKNYQFEGTKITYLKKTCSISHSSPNSTPNLGISAWAVK